MKITIYTVNGCEFSKQEKEYLTSHQLQFEEKNLEINKEFLTEMLAISDNFAGTPVTKIEKDDGQSVILKGFTKEEFDEALGFKVEPAAEQKDVSPQPIPTEVVPPVSTPTNMVPDLSMTPQVPAPVSPVNDATAQLPNVVASPPSVLASDVNTMSPPPTAVVEPPTQLSQDPSQPTSPTVSEPTHPLTTAPVVETPLVEAPKPVEDPKLASVLSNLQNMSTDPVPPPTPSSTSASSPPSNMPSIPDPNFG